MDCWHQIRLSASIDIPDFTKHQKTPEIFRMLMNLRIDLQYYRLEEVKDRADGVGLIVGNDRYDPVA